MPKRVNRSQEPKLRRRVARPDALFRAMSDPTRLAILRLLDPGELCVCDIVAALRVPQPKASRHLAYLRRSGLVEARRDGQWSYYRLAEPDSLLHQRLLDCLEYCDGIRVALPAGARCCGPKETCDPC